MAAHAASLTAAGAGKSGNPCDRLTPPYISLRRVISRMTDSVNCVAFFDPVILDMKVSTTEVRVLRVLCGRSFRYAAVRDLRVVVFFFLAGAFAAGFFFAGLLAALVFCA